MRIAPLAPVAGGLVAGIIVDATFTPTQPVYLLVGLCAALALPFRRVRWMVGAVLVAVTAACLGGMLHARAARHVPLDGIERYASQSETPVRVRGVVADEPRLLPPPPSPFARWSYGHERTVFLLEVDAIEGEAGFFPASGRLRVSVGEGLLDLPEGRAVEAIGMLSAFRPPPNPGAFDWAAYNRRQGIVASLRCPHRENVQPVGDDVAESTPFMSRVRARARNLLTGDLSPEADEQRSLLEAMILGHRSRLDRGINDIFIRAGCIHFLAVSGVHIVIVMWFARVLCRLFAGGPRASTWAMLIAVIAYAALAEPRPSIMRATVIAVIYCIARLIGRERTCLNWISATIIVLALIDPPMIFNVGYQLSTAAVIGVSYLSPALSEVFRMARRFFERTVQKRMYGDEDRQLIAHALRIRGGWAWRIHTWRWRISTHFAFALSISAAAWLAAGPIVAWHFHQLHPWAPIATLVAMPVVTLVMALGFTKLLAAAVSPALGVWLVRPLESVDAVLIGAVDWFASLPAATTIVTGPPWWWVVPYYLFLATAAWRLQRFRTLPANEDAGAQAVAYALPRVPRPVVAITGIVFALAVAANVFPASPSDGVSITVLSVGAGSAVVVELPDGRTVLCDVGSNSPHDVGANVVIPYLRHRGIERLERIYVSHPNLDHYNGVPSVVEQVDCGPVVVNEYFASRCRPRSPGRRLLDLLAEQDQSVVTLDDQQTRWEVGGVIFERLWPIGPVDETLSTNDTSTVLRISFAGRSMLLTGDIQDRAQRMLIQRGNIEADVLVLPHHGGVDNSLPAFLESVSPQTVVRSSHEPTAETLNGLPEIVGGIPMFNTADVGAVRVELGREGVRVFAASTPEPPS